MNLKAIALLLCLASRAPAVEKLGLPLFLKGNPALTLDFNFTSAGNGLTRVETVLGGRFFDIRLPPGSPRFPRFRVECQFTPGQGVTPQEGEPRGLAGWMDLAAAAGGKAFSPSLFRAGSKLAYRGQLGMDLKPGEYRADLLVEDEGLDLRAAYSLHLTVPALDGAAFSMGDLQFCGGVRAGRKRPIADLNPWRQVGSKAGWPLWVEYDLSGMPADWAGKPMIHRTVISKLANQEGEKKEVWEHEESRPAGREGSFEFFKMPPAMLKTFPSGLYLLLVEAWPQADPGARVHSYKSFQVKNP